MITVAKVPCGSCPYRQDVPSGIWERHEYDKLPAYDAPTWGQPTALFMCHQCDDNLCAGWLACHSAAPHEYDLLALALPWYRGDLDPAVFSYKTDVAVFRSGTEARAHGIRDINRPNDEAVKMVAGLYAKGGSMTDKVRKAFELLDAFEDLIDNQIPTEVLLGPDEQNDCELVVKMTLGDWRRFGAAMNLLEKALK